MKTCRKCRVAFSLDQFHRDSRRGDGRAASCRACKCETVRQYRIRNSDRVRSTQKASFRRNYERTGRPYRLLRQFGITLVEYDRLLAEQGGMCAICKGVASSRAGRKKALSVDHDHVTGVIRGLLCETCNTGLGMFRDDPALFATAGEYLRTHPMR